MTSSPQIEVYIVLNLHAYWILLSYEVKWKCIWMNKNGKDDCEHVKWKAGWRRWDSGSLDGSSDGGALLLWPWIDLCSPSFLFWESLGFWKAFTLVMLSTGKAPLLLNLVRQALMILFSKTGSWSKQLNPTHPASRARNQVQVSYSKCYDLEDIEGPSTSMLVMKKEPQKFQLPLSQTQAHQAQRKRSLTITHSLT